MRLSGKVDYFANVIQNVIRKNVITLERTGRLRTLFRKQILYLKELANYGWDCAVLIIILQPTFPMADL